MTVYYKLFLVLAIACPALGGAPVAEASFVYVGYEGCAMCHRDQYADWMKSKHAKAFELLKPGSRISAKKKADLEPDKDYSTSIKCLECHTTGYREPGGFVTISETPTRAGVGCEMCHGAGSEYRKVHKQKRSGFTRAEAMEAGQAYSSSDDKTCARCHRHKDMPWKTDMDQKYAFNLEERLKNTRSYHKRYD